MLPQSLKLPAMVLSLVLGGLLPTLARAAEPEKVEFQTVDEVTLQGTFFPSDKGDKAPCALLVHPIGGSSQHPAIQSLARKLQEKGFAVLTFDLRGHGGSTAVSSAFWKVPASRLIRGASPKKQQITYKEFAPGYFPLLVNDVAAARRLLDIKNDGRLCNSSNIVVVGVQDGAVLSAMWISSEWRRRLPKDVENMTDSAPCGADIICAAWLGFTPSLARAPLNVDKWVAQMRDRTPMAFLYGEDDRIASTVAKAFCERVLTADTPPRLKWTAAQGVKTKAAGLDLLNNSLPTAEMIVNYFNNVLAEQGDRPWQDRETRKSTLDFVPLGRFGFKGL